MHVVLPLIVAVSITLSASAPTRGIGRSGGSSGGALLLITLRLVPLKLAGQAVAKGSDVYLFHHRHDAPLEGLSWRGNKVSSTGWLRSRCEERTAVAHACSCSSMGSGTLVTIFMSNDATAVVLTRQRF